MERAAANCILCNGSERSLLFRQDDWSVYRCDGCGLGLLDPRPDPDELNELYRSGYFESNYGKGLKMESPEMKRRLSQETHRIRFFKRAGKRGRLLDIGCGMGYFLLACRNAGYEVEGMDISADSAAYVQDELKIPVAVGTIEGVDYPPASFDVITMWHFLEHARRPDQYIEKARRWLKPDGVAGGGCSELSGNGCPEDVDPVEGLAASLPSVPLYAGDPAADSLRNKASGRSATRIIFPNTSRIVWNSLFSRNPSPG